MAERNTDPQEISKKDPVFLYNKGDTAAFAWDSLTAVSYTNLRAHETKATLVCRLLLEK